MKAKHVQLMIVKRIRNQVLRLSIETERKQVIPFRPTNTHGYVSFISNETLILATRSLASGNASLGPQFTKLLDPSAFFMRPETSVTIL